MLWVEEWIEKYSNKYLGQTILPKIFPLQGWCRGNFFPSSISDPILTNILDKFPNCTKILVVGLHSLSGYKTWFLPLDLLSSALLCSPSFNKRWIDVAHLSPHLSSENNTKENQLKYPVNNNNKKILDKHWLSAEAEDVETAGPLIMWDCEMQNWR